MSDPQKYETTPEHFEQFVLECKRVIEFFGLYDWHVEYVHEDFEQNLRAECRFNSQGRIATIALAKEWIVKEPTPELIKLSAFHEMMELVLGDTFSVAIDTDFTPRQRHNELEKAQHAVIRRLENVIFPRLRGVQ